MTEQVLRTFVDTALTAEVHLVGSVDDVRAHAAAHYQFRPMRLSTYM